MFPNQPLVWRDLIATDITKHLGHIESESCWCDPIVEVDEDGQEIVIHREVTWH